MLKLICTWKARNKYIQYNSAWSSLTADVGDLRINKWLVCLEKSHCFVSDLLFVLHKVFWLSHTCTLVSIKCFDRYRSTPGNIYTLLNVVVVGTRNNTHNTIQQHTLLNVVVVGTRNNTHNTIQLHTLLDVVVVGTRNNTHNTIQLHTLLNVVVVGTRNNTHNTIQLHTLLNIVVVGTRNNPHNTIKLHTLLNVVSTSVTYEPS